jgi:hypothetical protein
MGDTTKYSEKIPGTRSNHHQPARFDLTGQHLGITQWDPDDADAIDRVLLSPAQVRAMLAFLPRHVVAVALHKREAADGRA